MPAHGEGPRIYLVPEHVVFRHFAAETVILNLQTGKYHGLNPTAGRMLERLAEDGDIAQAATSIASEFGQDPDVVTRDLEALVDQLMDRGVLQLAATRA